MTDEELLKSFISYFDHDKYKFENFCKIFLNWLDFDDITVTPKSGDHGIDLFCSKKEIEGLNSKNIEYIVQAKCNSIDNKITDKQIRDFKGTKTSLGKRRIFITTSSYTKSAIDEANDQNQPVTLISGLDIIDFIKNPSFDVFDLSYKYSKEKLDDLFKEDSIKPNEHIIEKRITKNDVRARILRIPSEIKEVIKDLNEYDFVINETIHKTLKMSSEKTYFAGVTEFYKDFIKNIDFIEAKSYWKLDKEKQVIYLNIK